MKAKVINSMCIGCGACQAITDGVFELNDDGIAETVKEVTEDTKEEVIEAKENCPTGAIVIEE